MKQIKCSLPNASDLINGVAFEPTDGGMLSVAVEPSVAAQFASIPGYEIVDAQEENPDGDAKSAAKKK